MTYTRSIVLLPEGQHCAEISCLAFSPMGTHLATGDKGGTVVVWNVKTGEKLSALTSASESKALTEVTALLWDASKLRALFIGRVEGEGERLPDALNVGYSTLIHTGTYHRMSCMDYDMQSRSLAVVAGKAVMLCRPMGLSGDYIPTTHFPRPRPRASSRALADGDIDTHRPRDIKVNRGATMVFVTYLEHGIVCWDVNHETPLWQLHTEPPVILHSAFFKDLRHVLVALGDGRASMHRVSEQRPRLSVQFQEEPQEGSYLEPPRTAILLGGRAIAVGAKNSPIRIWNLEGELLQEIHPDSARGRMSGVYAACNAGSVGSLACVVHEGNLDDQRITMFVTPLERNLRTLVAEFTTEFYMLYLQNLLERVAQFVWMRVLWILSFVLITVAMVVVKQPAVWAVIHPVICAKSLALAQVISMMLSYTSEYGHLAFRKGLKIGIAAVRHLLDGITYAMGYFGTGLTYLDHIVESGDRAAHDQYLAGGTLNSAQDDVVSETMI